MLVKWSSKKFCDFAEALKYKKFFHCEFLENEVE